MIFDSNFWPILLVLFIVRYLCLCELTDSLCQNSWLHYLFIVGFHKTLCLWKTEFCGEKFGKWDMIDFAPG